MTEKLQLYRCDVCGNLVQVILSGGGELVCCGQPMKLLEPKTFDEMQEKHVPVFITENDKEIVQVGAVPHPMIEEHHIMFIETISEDKNQLQLQYLYPNQEPKMVLRKKLGKMKALEYCNIHGLWEGESD